jgi:hypothetical protein
MRIGIVGAGPAGIITAIAICNKSPKHTVSVDLYDQTEPFRGRAFNTRSERMLLNTSVGVSFIDPDQPEGFIVFLNDHKQLNITEGDVVPRDCAVDYLKHEFEIAKKNAKRTGFHNDTVTEIGVDKNLKPWIAVQSKRIYYDAVVVTTGLRFKPPPEPVIHPNIVSPYPAHNLTNINREDSVLVLGSRLSAVDALVQLSAGRHKGRIDIYSRGQLFPSVRHHIIKPTNQRFLARYVQAINGLPAGYDQITCMTDLLNDFLLEHGVCLSNFIAASGRTGEAQLRHEVLNCRAHKNVWEHILMDIIDGLNDIWPCLTSADKATFYRDVNPWLGRIVHSMPLCNAETVLNLFETQQLRMLGLEEFLTADLRDYGVIVNATGLQKAEDDPLLTPLSVNKLLRFNGNGGVHFNADTHRIRDDLNIYVNGSIVQGEVFTSNSVYSTSYGAEKIARDIRRFQDTHYKA